MVKSASMRLPCEPRGASRDHKRPRSREMVPRVSVGRKQAPPQGESRSWTGLTPNSREDRFPDRKPACWEMGIQAPGAKSFSCQNLD